jgi:putative solute:sodium symporter small subunit
MEKTSFTSNRTGVDFVGGNMADGVERKPYWRQTKVLMLFTLAWPCLFLVGLPYWLSMLKPMSLAGLPIGYLVAVHGVVLVCIGVVARFAAVQERIDRWHGAHDDV